MRLRIRILSLVLLAALPAPVHARQPDLHRAGLAAPVHARQPDPHRAGLVVVHGDGSVASACVTFSEESITGAELLRRSGVQVTLGDYGGLGYGVCAIGDEGCPAGRDCFCQCRGRPCAYWVYSHRQPDGSWAASGLGASTWQVRDGDVDGWVWGDGSAAPPIVAFEQVCPGGAGRAAGATAVPEPLPATVTPAPLPNAAPTLPALVVGEGSEDAEPAAQAGAGERSTSLWSYSVFGIVILCLGGLLFVARLRGRRA
jgi:hypothetical protein